MRNYRYLPLPPDFVFGSKGELINSRLDENLYNHLLKNLAHNNLTESDKRAFLDDAIFKAFSTASGSGADGSAALARLQEKYDKLLAKAKEVEAGFKTKIASLEHEVITATKAKFDCLDQVALLRKELDQHSLNSSVTKDSVTPDTLQLENHRNATDTADITPLHHDSVTADTPHFVTAGLIDTVTENEPSVTEKVGQDFSFKIDNNEQQETSQERITNNSPESHLENAEISIADRENEAIKFLNKQDQQALEHKSEFEEFTPNTEIEKLLQQVRKLEQELSDRDDADELSESELEDIEIKMKELIDANSELRKLVDNYKAKNISLSKQLQESQVAVDRALGSIATQFSDYFDTTISKSSLVDVYNHFIQSQQ